MSKRFALRAALPAFLIAALFTGLVSPVAPASADEAAAESSAVAPEAAAPTESSETPSESSTADPSADAQPTAVDVADAQYADGAQLEVSGEIQVIDANVPLDENGVAVGPDVESSIYIVTENGDRIPVTGDSIDESNAGSTFEGTLALTPSISAELDVDPEVVAAASTTPLEEGDVDAQRVLASVSTQQVAMPVASGSVQRAAAPTTTNGPLAHEFYVAIVGAKSGVKNSTFSSSASSALVKKVSDYWTKQSGGIVDGITITKTVRFTSPTACTPGKDSVNKWWLEAGERFAENPRSFFGAGTGRHLVVFLADGKSSIGPCATKLGFTGLATVGAGTTAGGYVFSTVGTTLAPATLAHEFGHNLSLGHANIAYCASSKVSEAPGTGCAVDEYYDLYDVMGATVVGQKSIPSLSLPAKQRLGFLTANDVTAMSLASGSSTSTTTQVIVPVAGTTGVRGIAITDPVNANVYYVELRTGLGQDKGLKANKDSFSVRASGGRSSTSYGYGDGVRILTDDRATTRNPESYAIAMPSQTSASSSSRTLALDTLDGFSSASGAVHVDIDWTTPNAASVTVRLTSNATLVASQKNSALGGSAVIGKKLTAPVQFFRQLGVTRSFQWLRDGAAIAGATSATYTVQRLDAGAALSVRITGTRSGLASAAQVSNAVKTGTKDARKAAPVVAIAPDPAGVAGSAVTPYVIVYNGAGKSGKVTLGATAPSRTSLKAGAFDEDGIATIAVPWKLGAVKQTIVGRLSDGRSTVAVTVSPERKATSVSLKVPTKTSTSATAKVALAGVSSARRPGGTVEIWDGETLVASKRVTAASASIALKFDSAGTRELTAVYVGDTNYRGSTSSAKKLTVR